MSVTQEPRREHVEAPRKLQSDERTNVAPGPSGRSRIGTYVGKLSPSGMSGVALGTVAGAAFGGPVGAVLGAVLGGVAGEALERVSPSESSGPTRRA